MHHDRASAPLVRSRWSELAKRALSALVLGLIGVSATLVGVWPLAFLVAIVTTLLAWEWGRLVRNRTFDDVFYIHVATLWIAVALAAAKLPVYALTALVVGAITIAIRRSTEYNKLSAVGVLYIGFAVVGIIWLRTDTLGAFAVLFVFACVWAHDTVAMLSGRAVGGPRLWPSVSPKKTWSGAISGIAASIIVATAAAFLLENSSVVWFMILGVVLGAAALLGDLAESGLKRLGRVKNASGLIPGHGGFLDRLDGAIASFILACLIALSLNESAPARALLQLYAG